MKKITTLILFCIFNNTKAQTTLKIEGVFSNAKQKEVRLMRFMGTRDTLLSQNKTDTLGNFTLTYPKKYAGAATIQVKEITNLIVLLNNENFNLSWADFKDFDSVKFKNTKENEWFQKAYATNLEVQKRLAGLNYLLPLYRNDILKKEWTASLENQIKFENTRFADYQMQLPNTSYAKEYLNYRAILQKLQKEKKTKEEENEAEIAFLGLDFSSVNLFHSGLSKDLFDEYLKQILKVQNKEVIISKLNAFSELIKKKISVTPLILNDYSEYLIKQYEQFGLTEAAQKLALSLLDDNKCTIDSRRLPILEQYRKMAIGNVAPNLEFNSTTTFKSLKELKSKYKIIVFGASWCDECKKEMPQFKEYASIFREKYDAEIIFISIDTDKDSFFNFTKELPFISSCDFKGWEGTNVKNYYVFATPTIYILDENNKIVNKPINAIDTASWLYKNSK